MKEINVTFVTGNKNKAEYLEKLLGLKIKHQKVDLDEIQTLDLQKIVEHKLKQAYTLLKSPVLVEDVSLEFESLAGLPGTFIKFFIDNVTHQKICGLITDDNRKAIARCVFGYFDGVNMKFFEGKMNGEIAKEPCGESGYGFDPFFIPEGYTITRAQMDEESDQKTYLLIKPIKEVGKFLESL